MMLLSGDAVERVQSKFLDLSWKLNIDSNRRAPSTTAGSKYLVAIQKRREKQAKMTFQAALKFWQEFNVHDLQVNL